MKDTRHLLFPTDFPIITRSELSILQINLGYTCNLSCTHCHVNAGPKRTEQATLETIETILKFIDHANIQCLDLTGGAPEMNQHFRFLVREARKRKIKVIDRCNLTILNEPGYENLAQFLADNEVEVSASLPCYTEDNVNEQRGKGVFDSSIIGLKKLNDLGYGVDPKLILNLVYNPNGAFLPPDQQGLQEDYKIHLREHFQVEFNTLMTITNMPISRFGSVLYAKGNFQNYLNLLKNNFLDSNLNNVMCKNLISIDWQGYVYDCDFNQMLNLPYVQKESNNKLGKIATDKPQVHLSELFNISLSGNSIVIGEHCYGCTAGQGSSCSGALN